MLFLLGPLFLLWNNAVVLHLFQSTCVYISVLLAFRLGRIILGTDAAALAVAAVYAVSPHLHRVNRFEYHPETIALPLFMLLLLLFEARRTRRNLLAIGLVCGTLLAIKEDLPLTLGAFGLWVVLFGRDRRRDGLLPTLIGLGGFALIVFVVMPHFSGGACTHASRYGDLGATPGEILSTTLTRPDRVLERLVSPPVKIRAIAVMLLGFLGLPLLAPVASLTAFTPIAEHLCSVSDQQYTFQSHYSTPALPFLFYGAAYGLARLRGLLAQLRGRHSPWGGRLASVVPVALLLVWAGWCLRFARVYASDYAAFDPAPYIAFRTHVLAIVPEGSRLATTNALQTHLLDRHATVLFGRPKDLDRFGRTIDYIVLSVGPAPAGWKAGEYERLFGDARALFGIRYEDAHFLVLDTRVPGGKAADVRLPEPKAENRSRDRFAGLRCRA